MAPPEPSETIRGFDWLVVAVQSATPFAVHWGVPLEFTRRA